MKKITKDKNGNLKCIEEFDEAGKLIYEITNMTSIMMREYWYEYDEKGRMVYKKDSAGNETKYIFDDKGNCIYYSSPLIKEIRHYDDNSNIIYHKKIYHNTIEEKWWDYDENGNCIHTKNSNGLESWMGYDGNQRKTYYKNSNGLEEYYEYED